MNDSQSIEKSLLNIGHWNCRSINNKKLIFNKFMRDNDFDIFGLNETKLDNNNKREFELTNYNIELKNRNRRGGGVAILIKKNLKYSLINDLNVFNYEIIGIKVKLVNTYINVISLYLPPDNQKNKNDNQLTSELFNKLEQLKPFILIGDLNCHSTSWNCRKTSTKGRILNDYLENFNLNILNNSKYTHYADNSSNGSVIDLMIISSDLSDKFNKFTVHPNDMLSDHLPISCTFNLKTKHIRNPYTIYIKKTNWDTYKIELDKELNNYTVTNHIETDYKNLVTSILKAEENSTSIRTRKLNCKTIPKYLLEIINARKSLKRSLSKNPENLFLKAEINIFTKTIREELKAYRESLWLSFCSSLNHTKKYSGDYWNKIKKIDQLGGGNSNKKKKTNIPTLIVNNSIATTNYEKAQIFGSSLEKIFSDEISDNFDSEHQTLVNNELNVKINNNNLFYTREIDLDLDSDFTLSELDDCIKTLRTKSAPGNDGIKNTNLVNLTLLGKIKCLNIFNNSWKHGKLIDEWKTAEITMLKKKDDDLSNPNNYRPISLTKCLCKLMEKLVKKRLTLFLNKHNLLSNYQSGFREKRQTTDNLFFLSQKFFEAYDEGKSACGLVLDIQKAFDKVWHNGILYKLSNLKIPKKLGYWIKDLISDRKFYVKIEQDKSDLFVTTAGLAQGTILSPILFSIFINDITEIPFIE